MTVLTREADGSFKTNLVGQIPTQQQAKVITTQTDANGNTYVITQEPDGTIRANPIGAIGKPSATAKSSGGSTASRTVSGSTPLKNLSARAQAVYDNPALLNNYTSTEKGKVLDELAAAGVDLNRFAVQNVSAAQRTQVSQYDDLIREANNALNSLAQGLDVGPVASRIKQAQALLGGAQDFTIYRSSIDNMSSALLKLRSGAAVTPQEFERIKGFIPQVTDDEKTAKTKIERFASEIQAALQNYIKRSTQSAYDIQKSATAQTVNDPLGLR